MSSVANLLVSMKADFGNTNSQVDQLTDALNKLRVSVDDMSDAMKAGEDETKNVEEKVDELRDHINELSEKAQDFGKEFLKMGLEAIGVAGGIAGAFEVLKESMEVSAEIESVTVALTAFTGSAGIAADEIEQLESIAKSEALKFPEVLPAAQHFMALGFSAEQTTSAIQVAGNAAWALGTSVESVTQRMGMMAMGGMVSARFLRSLGIDMQDLAKVMGITGSSAADLEDKVRRAFKFESETDRLNALHDAMMKFGDLGGKEADTLSGKWIEMKNAMHEFFAETGDGLSGAGSFLLSYLTDLFHELQDIVKLIEKVADTVKPLIGGAINDQFGTHIGEQEVPTGPIASDSRGNRSDKKNLGIDLGPVPGSGAAAAAKALAESEASQAYARNKTKIDSEAATAKAVIELQRNYYKTQVEIGRAAAGDLVAVEKSLNDQEYQVALNAINRKKALQTSTKGLKEEEKDATLDSQAQAARVKNIEANQKLDDAELVRQHKFTESIVKATNERVIKLHEAHDKVLHELEAFDYENKDWWKKIADDELKTRDENARVSERQTVSKGESASAAGQQSIKASQIALETTYSLQYSHTLAQQVAYERQLGDLAARSLDIKARQLALVAEQSRADASRVSAALDLNSTDDDRRKADEEGLKADADALKAQEALNAAAVLRLETERKIAEIVKTQSISGRLTGQITSEFESLPGSLGGAIAGGITHQGKGGVDVGKQIADAMRNVGKQLLGDALTAAIKQLIVSLGLNTLAQAGLQSVLKLLGVGAQVGAQAAQTAALTTAITAGTGATVAGDAAILAEQTASNATTVGLLVSIDAGIWALFAKPSFLGTTFDTGGPVPHDMIAKVHAGEHVLNPDQVSGLAPLPDIPAFSQLGGITRSQGVAISSHSSSTSSNVSLSGPMHFHGVQNVRQLMKEIAETAKNASPGHSPLAR